MFHYVQPRTNMKDEKEPNIRCLIGIFEEYWGLVRKCGHEPYALKKEFYAVLNFINITAALSMNVIQDNILLLIADNSKRSSQAITNKKIDIFQTGPSSDIDDSFRVLDLPEVQEKVNKIKEKYGLNTTKIACTSMEDYHFL